MKKPFRYQSWSSDQELLDRIDRIKFENGDMNKDEELRYNSTLGKFQKGDKFGSLSDFKNDPKLFEPILDNLQKPNKYKKFAEDNSTRNYVWGKVLKNRRLKKSDYEGLSSSDIIVAEDKRERLKKLALKPDKPKPTNVVPMPVPSNAPLSDENWWKTKSQSLEEYLKAKNLEYYAKPKSLRSFIEARKEGIGTLFKKNS